MSYFSLYLFHITIIFSVRIPVNVWKEGDIVKIQMPPRAAVDQNKVETV